MYLLAANFIMMRRLKWNEVLLGIGEWHSGTPKLIHGTWIAESIINRSHIKAYQGKCLQQDIFR